MMTMLMGVLLFFSSAFATSAAVVSQCEAVADRVLVNADGCVLSWISFEAFRVLATARYRLARVVP